MQVVTIGGVVLLRFTSFPSGPLVHGLTTRQGGTSQASFDSLNVGFDVGDDSASVIANRRKVCAALEISEARFVAASQSHTANVAIIRSEEQFGGFRSQEEAQPNVDALVTNLRNVTLVVTAADCALLLFFDPKRRVLGLAHAGWKGATLNIVRNLVNTMLIEFRTCTKDLFVGVCPSISKNTYSIPAERAEIIRSLYKKEQDKFLSIDARGEYHLDIQSMLVYQLQSLGIERVEAAGLKTDEDLSLFYSKRKEERTGRMGLFANLLDK